MISRQKNGMWRGGDRSCFNGSRKVRARDEGVKATTFENTAAEISDLIYRNGPWPTAIRLANSFTSTGSVGGSACTTTS